MADLIIPSDLVLAPPRPVGPPHISKDGRDERKVHAGSVVGFCNGITAQVIYVGGEGGHSFRRISATATFLRAKEPYLSAYCHECQDERSFAISCIGETTELASGMIHASGVDWLETYGIPLRPNPERPRSPTHRWYMIEFATTLLLFLARHDGELHPCEREIVGDFIRERITSGSISPAAAPEIRAMTEMALARFPTKIDVINALRPPISYLSRRQVERIATALTRLTVERTAPASGEASFVEAACAAIEMNVHRP